MLGLSFRDLEGVLGLSFRDLEGVLGLSFRDTQNRTSKSNVDLSGVFDR